MARPISGTHEETMCTYSPQPATLISDCSHTHLVAQQLYSVASFSRCRSKWIFRIYNGCKRAALSTLRLHASGMALTLHHPSALPNRYTYTFWRDTHHGRQKMVRDGKETQFVFLKEVRVVVAVYIGCMLAHKHNPLLHTLAHRASSTTLCLPRITYSASKAK